ncbi:hypothetical protein E2562_033137 [Oryza meyeriana var. granulata]|uniref:PIR2-like helical domain-containing protein n=1 Tax=Oryza meyeriana var. granulata TaxID=110450 RepID=A0A6G1CKL5_9ORYZ|nr:hypothetical protein E2562_033137 [Oryza meyeriana var. granulata]
MALVSNLAPDLRIYKPRRVGGYPSSKEESVCRSHLLRKIEGFYRKAFGRLNFRLIPRTGARFLSGDGLCLGLLDPVSNIVVNTITPSKRCTSNRLRPNPNRVPVVDLDAVDQKELARRSLDGMEAFLIRFFPDLREWQAMRYLFVAGADLLVAAHIIVAEMGMKRFGSSEQAVKEALYMALECGALAAGHPDPDRLVVAWLTISSCIDEAVSLLALPPRNFTYRLTLVSKFARLLDKPPDHGGSEDPLWPWKRAASRHIAHCPCCNEGLPFKHTNLLNWTLQDTIHGFYLQALGRLPAGELRSRFHRSLLKAGHCYGPLDPVSNIIVNTIWYDAAFPPTAMLELDMIGTESLHRVENRSLYGLASFLCTRYHYMDFHQAVRCLLQADANLVLADPNLDTCAAVPSLRIEGQALQFGAAALGWVDARYQAPDTGVQQAFLAAATAAHHPNPDAQANLLTSCKAMMEPALALLQGCSQLSSQDVQRLAMLLSPGSPHGCGKPLPLLSLKGYHLRELTNMHASITRQVNAVLNAYKLANGVGSCL